MRMHAIAKVFLILTMLANSGPASAWVVAGDLACNDSATDGHSHDSHVHGAHLHAVAHVHEVVHIHEGGAHEGGAHEAEVQEAGVDEAHEVHAALWSSGHTHGAHPEDHGSHVHDDHSATSSQSYVATSCDHSAADTHPEPHHLAAATTELNCFSDHGSDTIETKPEEAACPTDPHEHETHHHHRCVCPAGITAWLIDDQDSLLQPPHGEAIRRASLWHPPLEAPVFLLDRPPIA